MTAATAIDRQTLQAAKDDPAVFARVLCGHGLWDHQREVVASRARYRIICSGRQAGKSRLLAILALHRAFAQAGAVVLVVSAGEAAAQRLLADVIGLATSPLLHVSVADETKGSLALSNGSLIMSVPASAKQIRGWTIDLLILDEAGFIDPDLWRAAEPVIIARPGSRVVLCSSPWGGPEHFFRQMWQRGLDRPDEMYASWHWPSTVSPLVDAALLEEIRQRELPDVFAREYLAQWTDEAGLFFTSAELDDACADYQLLDPAAVRSLEPWDPDAGRRRRSLSAAMGVDWGFARDAQAVTLVAALNDGGLNTGDLVYYLPWIEAQFNCSYAAWVDRLAEIASAYHVVIAASEQNGVGAAPTETLQARLYRDGTGTNVCPVWTDSRRKQSGFGALKMMLQRGQLVLPRHPDLLRQLRSLEFAQTDSGMIRLSVPERLGHDDLAMATMQAISCVRPAPRRSDWAPVFSNHTSWSATARGVRVPADARPAQFHWASFRAPAGREKSADAGW